MNNFLLKIKLIYLQYLLIASGFVAGYSFVVWLVVYQYPIGSPNEELVNFWLPFCLPVVPLYIWLRPRIKLLILKDKKGNLPYLYYMAAWFAIAVPAIMAQQYLLTGTGKLTTIKNISEINKLPKTRYYKITNHYIDKDHAAVHRRTEVGGRNSEYLTFHLYVSCPILNEAPSTDTLNNNTFIAPSAWLGTEYTKGISNRSSDAEKQQAFTDLGNEAYTKLKEHNLDQFIYMDMIGNNERRKGYYAAIKTVPQYKSEPLILEAKHEPFENRNGDSFGWIFKSFFIGAVVWFILLLFPKLDLNKLALLPNYHLKNQFNTFRKFISSIRISANTPVFIIIIALNIIVFIIMVFAGLGFISFDGQDLYAWGGNLRQAVIDGQWWRLLTNIFLHGGLMHLLFNMYGLLFVSIFLEPVLGKVKFMHAYFICGIMASLASIWWHPATLSVGASGAIFGLYGVLTALLTTNKVDSQSKKGLLINNGVFILINLVMGLAGGIDNAAHIGGLLTGFVIGYIMYFLIDAPKPERRYKRKKKITGHENKLPEGVD